MCDARNRLSVMSIEMYEGMVWMKTRQTRSRYEALDNKCAELNKQEKNLIPAAALTGTVVTVKQWASEVGHVCRLASGILGPLQASELLRIDE